MRILALDSSGLVASVAVVEDGAVDDQVMPNIQSIIRRHIHRHYFRCWTRS